MPTTLSSEEEVEKPQTPTETERLRMKGQVLLESSTYQAASAAVIMLNACMIGGETDFPTWKGWEVIENIFLFVFTVELLVRLWVLTPQVYFSYRNNPEFFWSVFDVAIVSLGLIDVLGTLLLPGLQSMKFATVFRMIRLCRVLRILRIFRFLKQLYLMAYGFTEAVLAMCWVSMFMTFILYLCGIVLARLYGHTSSDDKNHEFLTTRFASVQGSMLTLFELMASPDLSVYEQVMDDCPLLRCFLVCFTIFGSFGMIALLTGVISESMFEKNQAKLEDERTEREMKRMRFEHACNALFDKMKADEHGAVNFEELSRHQQDIADLISEAGMPLTPQEMLKLFYALDYDSSGGVDRMEFESGVMQICQDIRPMSIMEIHNAVRKLQVCIQTVDRRVEDMDRKFDGFSQTVHSSLAKDALGHAREHAKTEGLLGTGSESLGHFKRRTVLSRSSSRPLYQSSSPRPDVYVGKSLAASPRPGDLRRQTSGGQASGGSPQPVSLPISLDGLVSRTSPRKTAFSPRLSRFEVAPPPLSARSDCFEAPPPDSARSPRRDVQLPSLIDDWEPPPPSISERSCSTGALLEAARALGNQLEPAPASPSVCGSPVAASSKLCLSTQRPEVSFFGSSASTPAKDAAEKKGNRPTLRTTVPSMLADFRKQLEELAGQVSAEVQLAEEASSRLGELLMQQAQRAVEPSSSGSLLQPGEPEPSPGCGSERLSPWSEAAMEPCSPAGGSEHQPQAAA